MPKFWQWIAQGAWYLAFIAFVGFFSTSPDYRHGDPEQARITLSFSHAAKRTTECRRFTPEEIAQMAPNMRREMDCPRERAPLFLVFEIDGEVAYEQSLVPSGLSRDGASTVYTRFSVDAGRRRLAARLRDSGRSEGFDWFFDDEVDLAEGQSVVLDFRPATGGFQLLL